jgi:hypothetical protein
VDCESLHRISFLKKVSLFANKTEAKMCVVVYYIEIGVNQTMRDSPQTIEVYPRSSSSEWRVNEDAPNAARTGHFGNKYCSDVKRCTEQPVEEINIHGEFGLHCNLLNNRNILGVPIFLLGIGKEMELLDGCNISVNNSNSPIPSMGFRIVRAFHSNLPIHWAREGPRRENRNFLSPQDGFLQELLTLEIGGNVHCNLLS